MSKEKDQTKDERTVGVEQIDTEHEDQHVAASESGDGTVTVRTSGSPAVTPEPESVDWQDRYLRLAAEFDNFRKRSAREYASIIANAECDLIAELTEALDNLERARTGDHTGETIDEFVRGLDLIRDQIWEALAARGLERMSVVGERFDPGLHDAMMRMPSNEYEEGVIVQEVAPGYRLKDKVLRHARVIVSQGKPEEGKES